MQKLKTFLTVIGAVTILVLAANSAVYAATGGKFILGHKNTASKVSTLKRTTAGPALNLKTSSSSAPLQVNGTGKVANLNADSVDGLDSSAFEPRIAPLAWHVLSLTAGWHTCDTTAPSYAVRNGIVYFKGAVCGSGAAQMFTIPVGARPSRGGDTMYLPVAMSAGAVQAVSISTSDGVTSIVGSTQDHVFLDGLRYPID